MNMILGHDFKVGIIAATTCDVEAGVALLKKFGITNTSSRAVSRSPHEQTRMQQNEAILTNIFCQNMEELLSDGSDIIFVYCNSLSGAINIDDIRQKYTIPIITPLDAYHSISNNFNIFGVIAANCKSTANIESLIIRNNPDATIIGIGSLEIVKAVESGISPAEIITRFKLVEQCNILRSHGCEVILMACTHFSYFVDNLLINLNEINFQTKIFDPSFRMIELLNLSKNHMKVKSSR